MTATRNSILSRGFRRIGIDSPSLEDYANGAELLNLVVAAMDPEGRWLWTLSQTAAEFTAVAGQRIYTAGSGASNIPTDIVEIEPDSAALIRGTSRIPLTVISSSEALSSYELETESGEPYMLRLEKAPDPANHRVVLLPTPSGGDTVSFAYQRQLLRFANSSSTADFPESAVLDLVTVLAAELAPEHGYVGQEYLLLAGLAKEAKLRLRANNREATSARPVQGVYF